MYIIQAARQKMDNLVCFLLNIWGENFMSVPPMVQCYLHHGAQQELILRASMLKDLGGIGAIV